MINVRIKTVNNDSYAVVCEDLDTLSAFLNDVESGRGLLSMSKYFLNNGAGDVYLLCKYIVSVETYFEKEKKVLNE